MSFYSICDDCDNTDHCLCFEITLNEGEGTLYIPLSKYKNMYYNTTKNKTNTSIIIFQNFENTNKDKKRTVYRDHNNNCLYFKNFENKKKVYLIPEEFELQKERDEEDHENHEDEEDEEDHENHENHEDEDIIDQFYQNNIFLEHLNINNE